MLTLIVAVLVAVLTAWVALVVESLAGSGKLQPYFASELRCAFPPGDDDEIILTDDFDAYDSTGRLIRSRIGLESDGASVGALLRIPIIGTLVVWIIKGTPLTGPLRPAAIPHDELYGEAPDASFFRALISLERARADRIIYELAQCGVYKLNGRMVRRRALSAWRAFIVMALLRVGGVGAWMSDATKAARSIARMPKNG